ncbi:hypothetical protein [Pseudacidobacterium ailaaui]|jgi:hypothetical protein|uniref:hypothetical protein n=1 Tax=Pseudacidobacterium ailaaui TaxID=1382359 RepID=UPI00047E84AE|nr:hypothetical protein [Pseudacidobacterium ailaaui]MBX6360559.1 hypothetical protein [Pseudacidobacterium ailaaui]MCL6463276.1 hypothetical protein [Pseudacidobacterium ailaaui]MDI3255340.1 hypothetical protein [Bacillota bacterium]
MGYLQPTEYTSYGLAADTTDDWITLASALMENHCRRASLNPTQYTERLRLTAGSQTVRLTYLPLVPIAPATSPFLSIQARYARPRRGQLIWPMQEEIAWAFALPGSWTQVDPSTVDFVPDTGEMVFPMNVFGLPFNEVQVTYTAGLATIPDAVKSACALIVKNAQSTPGLNIKRSRLDTLQMDYFSSSLIDSTVEELLQPWVANRLG